MRHPLLTLLVASAGVLAPLASVHAERDPSASFLNAFMSFQQAEKLERAQSFKAALSKYRYTAGILDQIHAQNPEWQQAIVEYRQRKTAEAIASLEKKLALESPPAPAQDPADHSFNPNLLPGIDEMPQPDLPSNQPPPAPRPSASANVVEQAAQQIRSQMAALEAQLRKSQKQLSAVQQEKATLSSQLEEAVKQLRNPETGPVEAAQAEAAKTAELLAKSRANEERLRVELQKATEGKPAAATDQTTHQREAELMAELQKAWEAASQAKNQLAQAKTTEGELQTQLQDALAQLKKAQSGPSEEIKAEIAKLRNSLEDARADREVAEEQGQILARKMAALAKRPDLSKKLAEAEEKAKEVAAENARLTEATAAADKKLSELTAQLETQKGENTRLGTELATTKTRVQELEAAELKLIAAAQEKDAKNAELTTQRDGLIKERDTALSERDTALGEVVKAREAQAKMEKLIADNGELTRKLDEAEKSIAGFNSAAPEKEKELSGLKDQLTQVQTQLASVKEENEQNQNYVDELRLQLEESTLAASAATRPEDQKKLSQENDLLRGIVMRQLKDQARREQARKLVVSELSRLQVRSKALNEQVEFLGQPVVKLTDEERALFKTPQMEIVDNDGNAMAISIAAPQADGATSEAATPAASGNRRESAGSTQRPTGRDNLPADLQPLVKEAREKFDAGNYAEAETAYEQLVNKAPNNVYALSNLGVARFRSGKLKLAEEAFKKALVIAPNDAFSSSTLGIVYFQQSKWDDAIKALTRSLAIDPKNAKAHNYLGVTAAQKGWTEAAQKQIETALQIDPAYSDAHFNLAVVLATAQPPNRDKARKHYEKAIELGSAKDTALEALLK